MERDMDLIRHLLLFVEKDPRFDGTALQPLPIPRDFGEDRYTAAQVAYHVGLLIEAGFMKGAVNSMGPIVSRLTWDGHEFLANIQNQDVWSRTKQKIEGLPGIALSVVAEIAKTEIKKKLGLM